jgi:hypothetical protein
MGNQGGTTKWCPNCKALRVIESSNPSSLGRSSVQTKYRPNHEDIQYFQRALRCRTCGRRWLSAELPERFIDELVKLRNADRDREKNAEAYSKESENAAKILASLRKSLSDLRALNIYIKRT